MSRAANLDKIIQSKISHNFQAHQTYFAQSFSPVELDFWKVEKMSNFDFLSKKSANMTNIKCNTFYQLKWDNFPLFFYLRKTFE